VIATSDRMRIPLLLSIGGLGVSAVMTQLALMRELLTPYWGNELALGIILGNWLLLTGIGTWLGRTSERVTDPIPTLFIAQWLVALLPLAQVFLLRTTWNLCFLRGTAVGLGEMVVSCFVLLLPYCLVSGYLLTWACALLSKTDAGGAGRIYVADTVGSIVGGLAFTFVLDRFFDHIALLCFPAFLNLTLACWVAWKVGRRALLSTGIVTAVALLGWLSLSDPDALSTARQFAPQQIVFRGHSPYGRLIVTQSASQFDFVENGVSFASTHDVERSEETVHCAMAQRPDASHVLLISGGVSGTTKEILKYARSRVTYVELDPLIIEVGRKFMPESLSDARLQVLNEDGRLFVKRTRDRFDLVVVDVPEPSTSQINRFYTAEFFGEVKRVLSREGVLSFSLGQYDNYISKEMARVLASAFATVRQSFVNVLVLPGRRVLFLASDGPLSEDIAGRLEANHISTQWVQRHYLEAMLAPDRMADIRRAILQPADLNRDFSPTLCYYHLRHWMSQFQVRFCLLEAILLVLLSWYLVRLESAPLVLFASGFAASALEIVLLLAFQVLYGSVYHQVGLIVTTFMAGLALGSYAGTRLHPTGAERKRLAQLAFALAGVAALLPLVLWALAAGQSAVLSLAGGKIVILLITLLVAALVGMEFPLANLVDPGAAALRASRLYTADLLGASLGALLVATVLIPLLGMTVVCLFTAGLSLVSGVAVRQQKRVS
jgi:spermidine synthase